MQKKICILITYITTVIIMYVVTFNKDSSINKNKFISLGTYINIKTKFIIVYLFLTNGFRLLLL